MCSMVFRICLLFIIPILMQTVTSASIKANLANGDGTPVTLAGSSNDLLDRISEYIEFANSTSDIIKTHGNRNDLLFKIDKSERNIKGSNIPHMYKLIAEKHRAAKRKALTPFISDSESRRGLFTRDFLLHSSLI